MPHIAREYADVLAGKDDLYFKINLQKYHTEIEFDKEEPIGSGVFGNVFKVRRKSDGKLMAKKVNQSLDWDHELAILQKLDNKYIIKLLHYQVVESKQEFYFELMDGFTEIYLGLDQRQITFYLKKMLKALKYCHSMGIIHGDVKPENMVVSTDRKQLKLIDFGSAQWYRKPNGKPLNFEGTGRYGAPEWFVECLKPMIDYGVDVWSVGVILLEMLHVIDRDFNRLDIQSLSEDLECILNCIESLPPAENRKFKYVSENLVDFELYFDKLNFENSWNFLPLLANLLNIQIEERYTAGEAITAVKLIPGEKSIV